MKIKKGLWTGLVVVAFGTIAFADVQKSLKIQKIQNEISKKQANWQPRDSWITKLSGTDLNTMLGLQKLPQGQLDFETIQPLNNLNAVTRDWRNYQGVNWLGPVMNQGNCGSCVAFSTVATLEAQTSISSGIPWLRPSFSPQDLFSCGGGRCGSGWLPDDAATYLQTAGITDEACMPYTSGSTSLDASCSDKCRDSEVRTTKISGFHTPTSYGGSIDAVKNSLNKGPLVTTLLVYADFLAYGGGVYKHVTGKGLGGHAVSLVGYSDTTRAWLIRNSWGTEWGEHGFAWISWDDTSGVGANTWAFDVPPPGGLTVNAPADREYISGNYRLTAQSQSMKENSLQFRVFDSKGLEVLTLPCGSANTQNCSAQIDTTTLKEGRYQVVVETSAKSLQRSQIREFYVINSEPKMTLSFVAAEGTNLNAPVHGRSEFLIHATFSPIPIQYIEFRVFDQSGKIVSVKGNQFVLEQMKMGWRANGVPNGRYKILFHGETQYLGKVYGVDSNAMNITLGGTAEEN
ncbi:MAG: C1 family peptidase [Bdellovibrionia bacterium]